MHKHRLRDNPREREFAEAWSREFSTLAWILNVGSQSGHPESPSRRDEVVAATMIQWLGSPVGQQFLNSVGWTYTAEKKPGKQGHDR